MIVVHAQCDIVSFCDGNKFIVTVNGVYLFVSWYLCNSACLAVVSFPKVRVDRQAQRRNVGSYGGA